LSPAIHNAAFQHLGLNYAYLAFRVEDIQGAIQGIRALGNLRGFSVTIPYKVSSMACLDEVDPTAQHIGAINTIVKTQDTLAGFNTDAAGALQALQQAQVALSDSKIAIIGSGGAARAIAFGLALNSPIKGLTLIGIDDDERKRLAQDLRQKTSMTVEDSHLDQSSLAQSLSQAQILIHCTPVGMNPHHDATPVPRALLKPHLTVMDIVYNPLETRLLREAREAGCVTIRGIDMFLHQAMAQFELWTSQPAPLTVMKEVLESHFS